MHPALQQGTMASTHTAPSRRVFILNKECIVEPCEDNYPFRFHFLLNNPLQFHYITIYNSFGKQVIWNAGKAEWKISKFQEHSCLEVRAAVSVNKTTTRHGYSAIRDISTPVVVRYSALCPACFNRLMWAGNIWIAP
jgi:hypothetical protein